MALCDELPGVEVAVTVGGNDLKEYRDEDLEEEGRTTTRYIEAVSGQQFAIRIMVSKGFQFVSDTLSFQIQIDGRRVRSILVRDSDCQRQDAKRSMAGDRIPYFEMRMFEFARLEIVYDGNTLKGEAQKYKDLGTLQIRVKHNLRLRTTSYWSAEQSEDVGVVLEKALKGRPISHSVKLSEPEPVAKRGTTWETEDVPGYEEPIALFVFRYRSLDELRELQRRFRAMRDEQDSNIKIKRERRNEEEPRRRKIAQPNANSTTFEMDEDGGFQQGSTPSAAKEREVIELD